MRIASIKLTKANQAVAVNHFSCNTDEGPPKPRIQYSPKVPSGDFADSLAVFAAPKRMGLRSHIRLPGVLVKSSSITSSDSFNLCSGRAEEARGGWMFAETPFSVISGFQPEPIENTLMKNNHRPTPTYGVRHLILNPLDSNM
jgi:hypothetical protein